MKPDDEKSQEDIKRFDELQDMMIKAGLIVRHAHTKQANAAVFSQRGLMVVESIRILDSVGTLSAQDKLRLWNMLSAIANQRPCPGP